MTNTISKVIRNGTEYEFSANNGGVTSVNTQTGAVTVNDVKVSASAPTSPIEGMAWYDTTNDVLKTYNGSSWSEISGNTKTFYLSSTSDLTTAQAAYDWYLAGRNPIIVYNNETYITVYQSSTRIIFKSTYILVDDGNSASIDKQGTVTLNLSSDTVTSIVQGQETLTGYYLRTGCNYTTPYTPEYNGSPATKKYVDDNAGIQNDTTGTTTTVTAIRAGTEAEYALITPVAGVEYHIY